MQLWKASHGKYPLWHSTFSIKIFDEPGEGPDVSVEPYINPSTPQPDKKGWHPESDRLMYIRPAIRKNVEACLPGLKLTWTILNQQSFGVEKIYHAMKCNGVQIEVNPDCLDCHANRFIDEDDADDDNDEEY